MTTQTSNALARYGTDTAPTFILAGLDDGPVGDGTQDEITLEELMHPVRALVTEHNGLSAILNDGTFVAMFGVGLSPAERVERAATCALHLRALAPTAPMIIGRGDAVPLGGMFDRLVELLIHESFHGVLDDKPSDEPKPIRLDAGLADLLSPQFKIERHDATEYLVSATPAAAATQ
jgi:hypothetical protein